MFATRQATAPAAVGQPGGRAAAAVLPPEAVGQRGFELGAGRAAPKVEGGRANACCSFFAVLLAPLLLVVFFYEQLPFTAVASITLLFLCSLAALGNMGGSMLSAALTVGVLLSASSGLRCYYAHVVPLGALQYGRSYQNVFPQQPSVAFSDASMIRFAGNASVDESKALGMTSLQAGINTFCVAPLVDQSSVGRVEFWAVGVNCCGGQYSDFQCDDASDGGQAGGVVVPDHSDLLYNSIGKYFVPAPLRRDLFLQAVSRAEQVYELASSEHVVLVLWEQETRGQLIAKHYFYISSIVVLGIAASAAGAAILLSMGYSQSVARLLRAALCSRRARSRAEEQFDNVPPGFFEVQLLGFVLPLITLIACVVIFSWAPCWPHGNIILGGLTAILAVSAGTLMMARRSVAFGTVLLMAAVAGTFTGRWNYYRNTFHSCSVTSHQVYTDVKADADGAEYSDAGKVWFTPDASISEGQSVGFLYNGQRHCVAPVLPASCAVPGSGGGYGTTGPSEVVVLDAFRKHRAAAAASAAAVPALADAPAPAVPAASPPPLAGAVGGSACPLEHADFWVVGVDCCEWRESFTCYAPGDQTARAGMVIRDSSEEGVFDEELAGYYLAVRAAADLYGLPASDRPLLVHWGSDPEALRGNWATSAVKVIVLSTVLAFFALAMGANGVLAPAGRQDESGKMRRSGQDSSSPHSVQSDGVPPADGGSPVAAPVLPQPRSRRRREAV